LAGCPGSNPSNPSAVPTNTFTPTSTITYTPNATATAQAVETATQQAIVAATHEPKATLTAEANATAYVQATETATGQATATPSVSPTPYSSPLSFVGSLGQYGTSGNNGEFESLVGIAVGAGYLAIGDDRFPDVQVFNAGGTFLYNVTLHPDSPDPWGMAIDSTGELYVVDSNAAEVDGYFLGPAGSTYDYTWTAQGKMSDPSGVKIDANGNLVVADYIGGVVWNLAWADDSVLNQTGFVTAGGIAPFDVALDRSGNIYASDIDHNQIVEFNSSYQYTGLSFNGLAQGWAKTLNDPEGMGIDSQGNLFIGDTNNNRVVYATPQGTYLGEIDGTSPSSPFAYPTFLALDSLDDLFVTDSSNFVVDEFTE
jgi:hypothetical protein